MKKGNAKAAGTKKSPLKAIKDYMTSMLPTPQGAKGMADVSAVAKVVSKTPAKKGSGKVAKAAKNKPYKPKIQKMKAK